MHVQLDGEWIGGLLFGLGLGMGMGNPNPRQLGGMPVVGPSTRAAG